MDQVYSINGISIRLTSERWIHIIKGHPELKDYYFRILNTIETPKAIYAGKTGEYIATKNIKNEKYIVVIYKELENDGFVITAFILQTVLKN
ncbi:MAG: hypothetical protein ACP5OJ_01380 [Methanothermobacter sp.]